MTRNRSSTTETYLPFLGVHLRPGDGVPVHLAQSMAKAVRKAWLYLPLDVRMKLRRFWEKSAEAGGGSLAAIIQPTPAQEEYDPRAGMRFSAGRLKRMGPAELEAEAREHFARATLAANGFSADRAGVEAVLKSWQGGHRGRGREAIVLPQIKSAATRYLWGLPPLPQGMEEVVCPTLRDPETRRKWGLPELY